jgi:hypothetical protein
VYFPQTSSFLTCGRCCYTKLKLQNVFIFLLIKLQNVLGADPFIYQQNKQKNSSFLFLINSMNTQKKNYSFNAVNFFYQHVGEVKYCNRKLICRRKN